ncbi:hypothetical protein AHAS_Ahas19G0156900 [Arachis hypogaea]
MSTSRPSRNSDAPASTPAPAPGSASASAGHAAGTAARPATAVRATRIDPGWKYVTAVEEGNTNDTKKRIQFNDIESEDDEGVEGHDNNRVNLDEFDES